MRISDWSSDVCSSDLAFAAFVALLSASTLAYALVRHPLPWGALRLIDGICVAGVFVCLESWLGDRAEAGTRGTILASYMFALYSGQAIGQMLLRSGGGAAPHVSFALASILRSLRSEDRRVGTECVSTGRSRWSPNN